MADIFWGEYWFGAAMGYKLELGRAVLEVRPDMDNQRWYWSVRWPKVTHKPKQLEGGAMTMPFTEQPAVRYGVVKSSIAKPAKEAAEKAYKAGRPKE